MAFCDVCGNREFLTSIDNASFKAAVRRGFDPFRLDLPGTALERVTDRARAEGFDPSDLWRTQIVEQDTTNWDVCGSCRRAMAPFTAEPTRPTTPDTISATQSAAQETTCRCGVTRPALQWHCTMCGRIEWGSIALTLGVGLLLALPVLLASAMWVRIVFGVLAAAFLYTGISEIRSGLRARERAPGR
jgi:hypothetical protein